MKNKKIQINKVYAIVNITDPKDPYDEDYLAWDHRSDEELKQAAFELKEKYEKKYINETFKLVLREEFEQEITKEINKGNHDNYTKDLKNGIPNDQNINKVVSRHYTSNKCDNCEEDTCFSCEEIN